MKAMEIKRIQAMALKTEKIKKRVKLLMFLLMLETRTVTKVIKSRRKIKDLMDRIMQIMARESLMQTMRML
jgi:hypothetical protein